MEAESANENSDEGRSTFPKSKSRDRNSGTAVQIIEALVQNIGQERVRTAWEIVRAEFIDTALSKEDSNSSNNSIATDVTEIKAQVKNLTKLVTGLTKSKLITPSFPSYADALKSGKNDIVGEERVQRVPGRHTR
jgi:hypothetical protein